MSDLVERLLDRARAYSPQELTHQLLVETAARIKALEAGLKPFAELKPVAWSLDADMFYIATNDIRHAASLLEKKP